MSTTIEWTDVTDNIIVAEQGGWWCRKISPGCAHCYAEKLNQSTYFGGNKLPYTGEPPKLKLRREVLDGWKRQRKAKKHFVASMTDVFGEWVPVGWQFEMLDAMAAAPLQTFQVLTKRADVMALHVLAWLKARGLDCVPKNIWLGVTVENQQMANIRVPDLCKIPCIRFLSCEPMLSAVNLEDITLTTDHQFGATIERCIGMIHWIICGGESGKLARPMHPEWARYLRDQCVRWGIPFFFKQWGEWSPRSLICGGGKDFAALDPQCTRWPRVIRLGEHGKNTGDLANCHNAGEEVYVQNVGKKEAGRIIDKREWSEFPS